VLAARSTASIPDVRAQIARLHGRGRDAPGLAVADEASLGIAVVAALVEPAVVVGALGIAALVALQVAWRRRPSVRAVVVGTRQLLAGLGVVAATALGAGLA
jgi:hypothetical protein